MLVTKTHRDDVEQLFVVVRANVPCTGQDAAALSMSIKLVEAVPTVEEAEAEATRLGTLNVNKGWVYFVQSVRYFPSGRYAAPD